jgi:DNA end-binding protein Ku
VAARSIASLSLTFGLVSIPIKLYSATESSSAVKFKLMGPGGARVRQTYVADALPAELPDPESAPAPEPAVAPSRSRAATRGGPASVVDLPTRTAPPTRGPEPVELEAPVSRSDMVKGYEFQKGQFVLFSPEELKALEAQSRQTIDIVSFIPLASVDPIYFDKPYFLAPDKRGAKPYSLLMRAMQDTGRCALAKWAWRSKEYVVQIRAAEGGLVLQQLLYADEVRSIESLQIELVPVSDAELSLAKQIIEQISAETYDPSEYVDEEKRRILEAVERKIAGKEIITHEHHATVARGAEVVDLMAALRASLAKPVMGSATEAKRKPSRRAPVSSPAAPATPRKRAHR